METLRERKPTMTATLNQLPANFFTDLSNATPSAKWALEAFGGSCKSVTNAIMAIGLHKRLGLGAKDPIVMIETEYSGKFLKPMFDEAGIRIQARPTRSLADTKKLMQACRNGYAAIMLIDSIFHIYDGFVQA